MEQQAEDYKSILKSAQNFADNSQFTALLYCLTPYNPAAHDFSVANKKYRLAMQFAIVCCDFKLLQDIILKYKDIESYSEYNERIDIVATVTKAIDRFAQLESPETRLAILASPAVKSTKVHKDKYNMGLDFVAMLANELLALLLATSTETLFQQQLRDIYLTIRPHDHVLWFAWVTTMMTDKKSLAYKSAVAVLSTMLPAISVILKNKEHSIPLLYLSDFMEAVKSHGMLKADSLGNEILSSVENILVQKLYNAVSRAHMPTVAFILLSLSQIPKSKAYLTETDYWCDRTSCETQFRSNCPFTKRSEITEIYHLADQYKKRVKPSLFSSHFVHLEQLKIKNHPEAYLKIGELLIADLNTNTSETHQILRGAGSNLVKAILCKSTMVKTDFYKNLSFEKLEQLKQLTTKEKYTDQHRNIIHFYHALALLIIDKDEFTKTIDSLFKGKDHSLTAPFALDLCKNQTSMISGFVKHTLLKSLIELDSHIALNILDETKRLIANIPQDISLSISFQPAAVTLLDKTELRLSQNLKSISCS